MDLGWTLFARLFREDFHSFFAEILLWSGDPSSDGREGRNWCVCRGWERVERKALKVPLQVSQLRANQHTPLYHSHPGLRNMQQPSAGCRPLGPHPPPTCAPRWTINKEVAEASSTLEGPHRSALLPVWSVVIHLSPPFALCALVLGLEGEKDLEHKNGSN